MFIIALIYSILYQKNIKPLKYHKDVNDLSLSNDILRTYIKSGKPFLLGRLGSIESLSCGYCISYKKHLIRKKLLENIREKAYVQAGVFTNSIDEFYNFSKKYTESIKSIDIAMTYISPFEPYFFKKYSHNAVLSPFALSQPWWIKNPWTLCLKNKRVLIISPFTETIKKQFQIKNLIWPVNIFPDFTLLTYKSVNSVKGENLDYKTWTDALAKQVEDIVKMDFDIALLGCGAYAMPIGAAIKKSGRQAIVMCNSLQILFGIYGNRAGKYEYSLFGNNQWTRPSKKETPKNHKNIENSCYW